MANIIKIIATVSAFVLAGTLVLSLVTLILLNILIVDLQHQLNELQQQVDYDREQDAIKSMQVASHSVV